MEQVATWVETLKKQANETRAKFKAPVNQQEMASTSEELSSQGEQLQSTMGFFKTNGAGDRAKRKMLPGPAGCGNGGAQGTHKIAVAHAGQESTGIALLKEKAADQPMQATATDAGDEIDAEFEKY